MTEKKTVKELTEENIALKAQLEGVQAVASNRLLVMRRLEGFANDVNNLVTALRSDFAELNAQQNQTGDEG
jgi:hypothetical protein